MIIEKTVYRSWISEGVTTASKNYYLVEFEGTVKDLIDVPYITDVLWSCDDVIGSARIVACIGQKLYECKTNKDDLYNIPVVFRPDGTLKCRNPGSSLFIIEISNPQAIHHLTQSPLLHKWFKIDSGYGFSITTLSISPYKIAENSWAEMVKKEKNDMPPRLDFSALRSFGSIEPTANRVVPGIKNVIFNYPATIVFWNDGTKTVVKCGKRDSYSREAGLALCIAKKALGNKGNWYNEFKKYIKDDEDFVNAEEFVARLDAIREDIESAQKEKYVERLHNVLETIKFNKKTVLQLPVILNADVLDALEWLLTETLKEDKSQK